ncbi:MAG: GatB/YqeY domain-containing protein [Rhodospirillaceae bacterium]|nr:MAG: GatB/YqeY domain-containing protein [Rhodospirillaceae bacterium]
MSIRTRLSDDVKTAMKAKDERLVSTLRLILAALKDRDIAARPKGNTTGILEDEIMQMMNGMIKQRRDSITLYEQGNRPELAAKEQGEIDVIQSYLPQQMSADEMTAAIKAVIAEIGAGSVKDMGKVMGVLKERFTGRMDFASVSGIVKQLLAA